MDVTLVLVKKDGASREIPMKRARLVIGRQKGCDVRIPVATVSREHCELRVEDEGVVVRDLGSSNGTYVNKDRVQDQELEAGDLLAVGPAVFVVRMNGQPGKFDAVDMYRKGAGPAPVTSAAPAAKSRPSDPAAAKAGAVRSAAVSPAGSDDPNADSSVSDFDFDFLDDEDEKQPKL